jgi:hypothetical protein
MSWGFIMSVIVNILKYIFKPYEFHDKYTETLNIVTEEDENIAECAAHQMIKEGKLFYDDIYRFKKKNGDLFIYVSRKSWQPDHRGMWIKIKY